MSTTTATHDINCDMDEDCTCGVAKDARCKAHWWLLSDDELAAHYASHLAGRGLRRVPFGTPRAKAATVPAPLTGAPVLVWTLPLKKQGRGRCSR